MFTPSHEVFRRHPVASASDVDQAQSAISEAFLPVDLVDVSTSTNLSMSLNVIKVGHVTAGYLRLGDAIRVRTADATNYHIDIPVAGRATMRSGRRDRVYCTRRTAAVFMPGLPADLDCDRDLAQVCLMLAPAELQSQLEKLLGRSVNRPLDFSSEMDLTTTSGRMFLQALQIIDTASEDGAGVLEYPLAAQRLEQVLVQSLLLSQPHNYSDALRADSAAAGARPVARAVEVLRATPGHAWTVAELAFEVSISVRSLQEGFRRSLGCAPMAYLRRLRLERVRSELAAAEPGSVTVTDVAARWGFTHLGWFAAAYRGHFGERPSDTLKAKPHCIPFTYE
ncbi:AraC-like ligand-binding domain-containing protein [Jatrophihabitans sp. DSM 45814]